MAINDVFYLKLNERCHCMLYVPVYYFGHLIDVLHEHAFPIDEWLKEQGIDQEKLYASDTKIDPVQFDELLQAVLSKKSRAHLGLSVGRKLQVAHHGTFGLALLNCQTIEEIIKFVQQFLLIRIPFIEIGVVTTDDECIVLAKDTHWEGDLHRFVIEAVLGAVINIFTSLQQKVPSLSISRLFFDFTCPPYVDKYKMLAAERIEFNHGYCGIAFSQRHLHMKIPDTDRLSFYQAQKACEQERERWLQFANYSGKVMQCFMQKHANRINLNEVAGQLHISPRSLHRYLKEEGTSFKVILDTHQAAVAKECLVVYAHSVTQTAAVLGYVDVANFRRAFKRWYKCTPSEFVKEYHLKETQ
jgi:AraC-like DNA-binding protein